MDLREYIIDTAYRLGIDIIRFTSTESFEEIREFLVERERMKYETEFEEKDIELRYNPKKLLPNGKTIIVIGLSYNVDNKKNNKKNKEHRIKGKLSKSTWGIDYHKVLKEKMKLLVNEIKKIEEFDYKIYVDTGPLIDRIIAKRAGVGWYGKNCSIINDDYGSFIFIGYIITSLNIKEDEPIEEKCGDCRLCINACPTGAIGEGYKINAKRCISYLTQTKTKIPYELREKMGVKIYGCDTCQIVCPKNKYIKKGKTLDFLPKKTGGYIDLEELLTISNRQFKEKYGHISASWRGKNILKRNAIIAIGNTKNKEYIDILKHQLDDPSPMIREYAAWAILRIDREIGSKIVIQHLEKENDSKVKEEINKLLSYFEGE
jgi:epoxyqueuosine reductase